MIFRYQCGIEFGPPPALDSGNGSVAFRKFDLFVFGTQKSEAIEIQIGDDQPLALRLRQHSFGACTSADALFLAVEVSVRAQSDQNAVAI